MAYKLDPQKMYRMPTHFGPSLGPRQGRNGQQYTNVDSPKKTVVSVSFLSEHEQLEALLPEGFGVNGEPVVTISASYVREIEWLAGRGYNMLGVSFPATFRGQQDRAKGHFLAVLWENLADPIITGREELGFSKIYCELPEYQVVEDEYRCSASWLGFQFLEMRVTNVAQLGTDEIAAHLTRSSYGASRTENLLHYKYMPRTGAWGEADACYATISPAPSPGATINAMWRGVGTVNFRRATWEELPTLFHIVNTLEELVIKEYRGATIVKTVGGGDFRDQSILR
jgi:hypothetical protein